MKLISRNQLRTLLLGVTANTIISMVVVTEPDTRATGTNGLSNPFKAGRTMKDGLTIGKVTKVNGTIAGRYERVVENRLAKVIEAERAAANLAPLSAEQLEAEIQDRFRKGESWHRPIMAEDGPTCLSVNKKDKGDDGAAYLRFIFKAVGTPEYLRLADGTTEPTENVEPYLAPRSDYSNQGLGDDAVKFVVYGIENIVEIAIGGERYRITDNFTDRPMEMRERIWDIAEAYLIGERSMMKV
jgi:hypothetical protein